jgi:chemotaxis protein histidine kinase CheA
MDNDIAAVFLEEASELLESLEQGLLSCRQTRTTWI